MRRVVIVRHGNTFRSGETPTRVGKETDLPLVEEHRARSVGRYLSEMGIVPDRILAAPLKRTTQTAELIAEQMGLEMEVVPQGQFSEIDYGPDENKTEREVELRLGRIEMNRGRKAEQKGLCALGMKSVCSDLGGSKKRQARAEKGSNHGDDNIEEQIIESGRAVISQWDSSAIVPDGWSVDPDAIVEAWRELANGVESDSTVLISSSNGVIRFAPHILNGDYEEFCLSHNIKVATGSVSIFVDNGDGWLCSEWNIKPYERYREI